MIMPGTATIEEKSLLSVRPSHGENRGYSVCPGVVGLSVIMVSGGGGGTNAASREFT